MTKKQQLKRVIQNDFIEHHDEILMYFYEQYPNTINELVSLKKMQINIPKTDDPLDNVLLNLQLRPHHNIDQLVNHITLSSESPMITSDPDKKLYFQNNLYQQLINGFSLRYKMIYRELFDYFTITVEAADDENTKEVPTVDLNIE